jgi:hypothetical protein
MRLDRRVADEQVEQIRRLIDGLRRDRRQHPYSGRAEYSRRAREAIGALEDMIEAADAAGAVPLAKRAVERVTAALQYMDDSSGIVGDDLRVLMALYSRACRIAPPDSKRLAGWLVMTSVDGPGWPDIELTEFADALGEPGLAEVARLVGERAAAEKNAEPWTSWRVKDLREQLAALSGDVDAHVAVLAEDLRGARRYGEIVDVLRDAGRHGEAERWARKGLMAHLTDPWSDDLRDRLAEILLTDDRGDEAVALLRGAFERRTIARDYLALRRVAERAGRWADLRDWALGYFRDRAREDGRYITELINVLLREELLGEAWDAAVANPGRLHESVWFQLIGLRENDHPADVIGPLEDLIENGIERTTDKYRYPKAIKNIHRLRDAYRRAGNDAGFGAYLGELRQRQRRKTSFIAKLDKALG